MFLNGRFRFCLMFALNVCSLVCVFGIRILIRKTEYHFWKVSILLNICVEYLQSGMCIWHPHFYVQDRKSFMCCFGSHLKFTEIANLYVVADGIRKNKEMQMFYAYKLNLFSNFDDVA